MVSVIVYQTLCTNFNIARAQILHNCLASVVINRTVNRSICHGTTFARFYSLNTRNKRIKVSEFIFNVKSLQSDLKQKT